MRIGWVSQVGDTKKKALKLSISHFLVCNATRLNFIELNLISGILILDCLLPVQWKLLILI